MSKIAAVTESIQTNSIVHVEHDEALADMLAAESEDCTVDNKGTTEYWGTDEDGNEWRVHMARAEGSE